MRRKPNRLKISPVTIGIAVIILAVAGHLLVIAKSYQEHGGYDANVAELEAVESTIDKFKDIEELQGELLDAESQLEAARSIIPEKQSNTLIIESLVDLSKSTNIEISNVRTQIGDNEDAGEQAYQTMSIRLRVNGSLGDLVTFLSDIENGALQAGRVDELTIIELSSTTNGGPSTVFEAADNPYENITLAADMRISIFTRL